mmetsp:Transcript_20241/g.56150  ORF Transcript_20241/g.56150 Transcript_20241/m.56150 type:complete len:289 (+) Transcript_20241:541-1407(+)
MVGLPTRRLWPGGRRRQGALATSCCGGAGWTRRRAARARPQEACFYGVTAASLRAAPGRWPGAAATSCCGDAGPSHRQAPRAPFPARLPFFVQPCRLALQRGAGATNLTAGSVSAPSRPPRRWLQMAPPSPQAPIGDKLRSRSMPRMPRRSMWLANPLPRATTGELTPRLRRRWARKALPSPLASVGAWHSPAESLQISPPTHFRLEQPRGHRRRPLHVRPSTPAASPREPLRQGPMPWTPRSWSQPAQPSSSVSAGEVFQLQRAPGILRHREWQAQASSPTHAGEAL